MHQLTNRNTGALKTQLMADQRQLRIRAGCADVVARRDRHGCCMRWATRSRSSPWSFSSSFRNSVLVIRKLIACQAPQARVLREDGVGKRPVGR